MPGIYLHVPFCDTKCIYCDFYSITNHSQKEKFISALKKEIVSHSHKLSSRKFDTIFFGGGTPSLLSYSDFNSIFEALYSTYNISPESEITIESNPGTLNAEKLREFKKLPINRISLGVQSFIDSELKFLTRIHSAGEAVYSVKTAQDLGFENINVDLIFALPNQNLENWKYNLETAVGLNTQHISAYSLIFEEGTPLFNLRQCGKVNEADIELEHQMFEFTMEYLKAKGFKQYEISNYAKDGFECKHNLKYWNHEEYIAFGPSASSFIAGKRWTNVRNLAKCTELVESGKDAADFTETIDTKTSIYEHIFLGLRSKGIELNDFKSKYKFDFREKYSAPVKELIKNGFAEINNDTFRLTTKGYALCDEIASKF
ncbi:MAG: radical SAM family heme chaperone HemW [Chlorobi bacterium]|nr:radical SAM family heme chaperone HemW [Chlorobiota bacterium]MCI0717011.1 radical SAM family heme chaperone HemW [Chlorobiota bacterium]